MSKKHSEEKPSPMKGKEYDKELRKLQTELCKLQAWVLHKGLRVIVVFEGRDAAGKGGTIKALTEHFPAAGEVIIFDRSWYNRAGVEYVMDFCTKKQYETFVENCPTFERHIVKAGIILVKLWLEVGKKEQKRRFEARIEDPLRQWKLSPMDLASYSRWYAYSEARDLMLEATDIEEAPWYVVRSDDKRRARLNIIAHLLSVIPYEEVPHEKIKLPDRSDKGEYDDQATLKGRKFVAEKY